MASPTGVKISPTALCTYIQLRLAWLTPVANSTAKLPVRYTKAVHRMVPMTYQMETYICTYLRRAMVAKMLAPNITQAITTRTSSASGSSAYSRPWFHPASSATTAPSTITFHNTAVATPSFSLQSGTPHRRGTR
ncbi:MAG: hypothetical protein BWY76_03399 [bacterium ADurb.Bin429]|nr:MAG: hypothetical protein BWY76_03399 [bacterium ADurb.Bin429]